jgi:hypothetical protein
VLIGFAFTAPADRRHEAVAGNFHRTASNRFDLLKQVADELHAIAAMITAGLGLFVPWSHRRTRSIKLVATRPGSFDAWVASFFIVPAIFGAIAQAAVAAIVAYALLTSAFGFMTTLVLLRRRQLT